MQSGALLSSDKGGSGPLIASGSASACRGCIGLTSRLPVVWPSWRAPPRRRLAGGRDCRLVPRGLELVVSLLEPEEVDELGLTPTGRTLPCSRHLSSYPSRSRIEGVPTISARRVLMLAPNPSRRRWPTARSVAVHCRAGIGRSSGDRGLRFLACAGLDAERALVLIKEARGANVPDTPEQRRLGARLRDRVPIWPDGGVMLPRGGATVSELSFLSRPLGTVGHR